VSTMEKIITLRFGARNAESTMVNLPGTSPIVLGNKNANLALLLDRFDLVTRSSTIYKGETESWCEKFKDSIRTVYSKLMEALRKVLISKEKWFSNWQLKRDNNQMHHEKNSIRITGILGFIRFRKLGLECIVIIHNFSYI
jgi:hypothetical protein